MTTIETTTTIEAAAPAQATAPTFNISFAYYLSPAGQETSLRQGRDGHQRQVVAGQVTLDQYLADLKPLGWSLNSDGQPRLASASQITLEKSATLRSTEEALIRGIDRTDRLTLDRFADARFDTPQTFEALYSWYLATAAAQTLTLKRIAEQRAAHETEQKRIRDDEERQKREARQEIAFVTMSRFRENQSLRGRLWSDGVRASNDAGEFGHDDASWVPQWVLGYAEFRAEAEARNTADKARAEAEEAARAQAKTDQIAVWVVANGDDNQKARLAEGLLPMEEITALMEAEAFAAAPDEEFPPFHPITKPDVRKTCSRRCACEDEYSEHTCKVSFTVEDAAPALPAAQFGRLTALREALPDADIQPRMHRGYCEDEYCKTPRGIVRRIGFYARITVGAFTFKREFAAE